ncbi:hypothetical protein Agub_g11869 [Astrephomene gubernaculifera]|uniref:Carbohydrate sulfotransferase n=1 Tax=Astrephomene gubernaculifera TaxID=47775 RepID=A0AAD3HR94_9CHLO|nr:hypothetical protein Agub_g11869 [Astrephomene gubernaculifera]
MDRSILVYILLAFILLKQSSAKPRPAALREQQVNDGASVSPLNSTAITHGDTLKSKDYWERLVGTPSKLSLTTKKKGVLPTWKYNLRKFDVVPFQAWLRKYSLLDQSVGKPPTSSRTPPPQPPLSYICGVYLNPTYKFIFVRNRKTASSTFLTVIKTFMLEKGLCNVTRDADGLPQNNCISRMDPEELLREGRDPDAMWRDYLVITSSRNPWARAASGYQFTFDEWHRRDGGCQQPSFLQFCRDPFIMGKLSNLFSCVGRREGVGPRNEGHWNFDFCHVEPAAACMMDQEGRLVVDFLIRYERLDEDMQAAMELINSRRPAGLPPIVIPQTSVWRKKGTAATQEDINSTDAAAYVYAGKYRECGYDCVEALSSFYAADLKLFGWQQPKPPTPED